VRVRFELRDLEQRQAQGLGSSLVAGGAGITQHGLELALRFGDHVFQYQHELVRALDAMERVFGCFGHLFINAHASRERGRRCYNEPNFS